jgi:hypothetical protein
VLVLGCACAIGVLIAACACSFVCVMCVCLYGVRGVGEMRCSCSVWSRVEVVHVVQDVLMCVIACEWVVWAIIVLFVRVCGLAG